MTMAHDKTAPLARMEINCFIGRFFRQLPDPVSARSEAAARGLHPQRLARALNRTFGDHPCRSRAMRSMSIAGRGPSSSAENKNSGGLAPARQPPHWLAQVAQPMWSRARRRASSSSGSVRRCR
jgi:hypothetical protein